jgi:nucleoid-associated protein YgaU
MPHKKQIDITEEGAQKLDHVARLGNSAVNDLETLFRERTYREGEEFTNARAFEYVRKFFNETLAESYNEKDQRQITHLELRDLMEGWAGVQSVVSHHAFAEETLSDGRKFGEVWKEVHSSMTDFLQQASSEMHLRSVPGESAKNKPEYVPTTRPPPGTVVMSADQTEKEHATAMARLEAVEEFRKDYPELAKTHNEALNKYAEWNQYIADTLKPGWPTNITPEIVEKNKSLYNDAKQATEAVKLGGNSPFNRTLGEYLNASVKRKLEGLPAIRISEEDLKSGKENTTVTVKKEDELWNISRDYYDLEDSDRTGIQNAVNHVAYLNGFNEEQAHKILPDQKVLMPSKESLKGEVPSLDWEKMDRLAGRSSLPAGNDKPVDVKKDFSAGASATPAAETTLPKAEQKAPASSIRIPDTCAPSH